MLNITIIVSEQISKFTDFSAESIFEWNNMDVILSPQQDYLGFVECNQSHAGGKAVLIGKDKFLIFI